MTEKQQPVSAKKHDHVISADPESQGRVSFDQIPENNPADSDIVVSFTHTTDYRPKLNDWVGLFRCVKSRPHVYSFVAFKWAPLFEGSYTNTSFTTFRRQVTFTREDFQKDEVTEECAYKCLYMSAVDKLVCQSNRFKYDHQLHRNKQHKSSAAKRKQPSIKSQVQNNQPAAKQGGERDRGHRRTRSGSAGFGSCNGATCRFVHEGLAVYDSYGPDQAQATDHHGGKFIINSTTNSVDNFGEKNSSKSSDSVIYTSLTKEDCISLSRDLDNPEGSCKVAIGSTRASRDSRSHGQAAATDPKESRDEKQRETHTVLNNGSKNKDAESPAFDSNFSLVNDSAVTLDSVVADFAAGIHYPNLRSQTHNTSFYPSCTTADGGTCPVGSPKRVNGPDASSSVRSWGLPCGGPLGVGRCVKLCKGCERAKETITFLQDKLATQREALAERQKEQDMKISKNPTTTQQTQPDDVVSLMTLKFETVSVRQQLRQLQDQVQQLHKLFNGFHYQKDSSHGATDEFNAVVAEIDRLMSSSNALDKKDQVSKEQRKSFKRSDATNVCPVTGHQAQDITLSATCPITGCLVRTTPDHTSLVHANTHLQAERVNADKSATVPEEKKDVAMVTSVIEVKDKGVQPSNKQSKHSSAKNIKPELLDNESALYLSFLFKDKSQISVEKFASVGTSTSRPRADLIIDLGSTKKKKHKHHKKHVDKQDQAQPSQGRWRYDPVTGKRRKGSDVEKYKKRFVPDVSRKGFEPSVRCSNLSSQSTGCLESTACDISVEPASSATPKESRYAEGIPSRSQMYKKSDKVAKPEISSSSQGQGCCEGNICRPRFDKMKTSNKGSPQPQHNQTLDHSGAGKAAPGQSEDVLRHDKRRGYKRLASDMSPTPIEAELEKKHVRGYQITDENPSSKSRRITRDNTVNKDTMFFMQGTSSSSHPVESTLSSSATEEDKKSKGSTDARMTSQKGHAGKKSSSSSSKDNASSSDRVRYISYDNGPGALRHRAAQDNNEDLVTSELVEQAWNYGLSQLEETVGNNQIDNKSGPWTYAEVVKRNVREDEDEPYVDTALLFTGQYMTESDIIYMNLKDPKIKIKNESFRETISGQTLPLDDPVEFPASPMSFPIGHPTDTPMSAISTNGGAETTDGERVEVEKGERGNRGSKNSKKTRKRKRE